MFSTAQPNIAIDPWSQQRATLLQVSNEEEATCIQALELHTSMLSLHWRSLHRRSCNRAPRPCASHALRWQSLKVHCIIMQRARTQPNPC
jgi:hypothetical protein